MTRHDEPDPDLEYDRWRERGIDEVGFERERERDARLPRIGAPMPPSVVAAETARHAAAPLRDPTYVRGTSLAESPHMQQLRALAGARLFEEGRRR